MCSRRRLVAPQKLRCRLFVRYILLLLVFLSTFFFFSLSVHFPSLGVHIVATFRLFRLSGYASCMQELMKKKIYGIQFVEMRGKKKHEFISYISRALETALFVTQTHRERERLGLSLWRARARTSPNAWQKKKRIVKHNEPVQAAITGASIDVPHLHVLGAVVISLHFFPSRFFVNVAHFRSTEHTEIVQRKKKLFNIILMFLVAHSGQLPRLLRYFCCCFSCCCFLFFVSHFSRFRVETFQAPLDFY